VNDDEVQWWYTQLTANPFQKFRENLSTISGVILLRNQPQRTFHIGSKVCCVGDHPLLMALGASEGQIQLS